VENYPKTARIGKMNSRPGGCLAAAYQDINWVCIRLEGAKKELQEGENACLLAVQAYSFRREATF
jgi:hypothetical protein